MNYHRHVSTQKVQGHITAYYEIKTRTNKDILNICTHIHRWWRIRKTQERRKKRSERGTGEMVFDNLQAKRYNRVYAAEQETFTKK